MLPDLSAVAAATYKGVKAWCREAKEACSSDAEKECVSAIKAAAQEGKATFDPRNPNAAAAAKAIYALLDALTAEDDEAGAKKKRKKEKKSEKKEEEEEGEGGQDEGGSKKKRKREEESAAAAAAAGAGAGGAKTSKPPKQQPRAAAAPPSGSGRMPPHKYVLAPMVGGSELAFRTLCRRYGADLCYTPMMYSHKFVEDPAYREAVWHTAPADRPLVAHFAGNDAATMVAAGKLVEGQCDAVDVNLGCPQRIAHSGHFGSYLLQHEKDLAMVCGMVKAMSAALSVPVFCKIRLLATVSETISFVKRLKDAGAALVAVHGRYPTWLTAGGDSSRGSATHRRDGAAHLDQVAAIRAAMPEDFPILSNGNVRCGQDVVDNLKFTKCDGVMTAEGILDDPSIFATAALGGLGPEGAGGGAGGSGGGAADSLEEKYKQRRKLEKKLREIERLEALAADAASAQAAFAKEARAAEKAAAQEALEAARSSGGIVAKDAAAAGKGASAKKPPPGLEINQLNKIKSKPELLLQLDDLPQEPGAGGDEATADGGRSPAVPAPRPCKRPKLLPTAVLSSFELHRMAAKSGDAAAAADAATAAAAPKLDKLSIASEYLDCVDQYPASAPLSTVIFHVRRIARAELNSYQLMNQMNLAESVKAVRELINRCHTYQSGKVKHVYDPQVEADEFEAAERKKREEGKRKAFEARMVRKAKREGKDDLSFYLKTGLTPPSKADIAEVQAMSEAERMASWKARFGQHCMAYHLGSPGGVKGCARDRTCAFLHADALVTAAGETSGSATAEGEPTWLNENNE